MERVLMKGNEALAEAAIQAGCRCYYGYPITPQTEIASYMAANMTKAGGVYLQAESEIAAINMALGSASAGKRVMSTSSGPGMSLKQEGISYISGSRVPCVLANVMRVGPGLGGILASQSDYFQSVKGGGHGDYRVVVLAPTSVQEIFDLTQEAFEIADTYNIVSMILIDGILGQMMEPVEIKPYKGRVVKDKNWALTGTKLMRKSNFITSLYIDPEECEKYNIELQDKYALVSQNEVRYEEYNVEEAEMIIVAYGACARIAKSVIKDARKKGINVGLIRPITLWPFPVEAFNTMTNRLKGYLSLEMSAGQMVEDVKLAVNGRKPVYFYGRMGGIVPTREEVLNKIEQFIEGRG